MSDNATTAERYRAKADECVSLAKSAISNEVRALHYAMAERYLKLAEDEMKRAEAEPTRERLRARAHMLGDAARAAYGKTAG